jgi:hypothetical protein
LIQQAAKYVCIPLSMTWVLCWDLGRSVPGANLFLLQDSDGEVGARETMGASGAGDGSAESGSVRFRASS